MTNDELPPMKGISFRKVALIAVGALLVLVVGGRLVLGYFMAKNRDDIEAENRARSERDRACKEAKEIQASVWITRVKKDRTEALGAWTTGCQRVSGVVASMVEGMHGDKGGLTVGDGTDRALETILCVPADDMDLSKLQPGDKITVWGTGRKQSSYVLEHCRW